MPYIASMPKYQRKTVDTSHIRPVHCRAHHLHWIRGLLIAHERRDITWKEFREMAGISDRYAKYLRAGHRVGGRETVRRLIQMAREHGVIIHVSDFYDDDPILESEQIWRQWKDYTH